MSDQTDKPKLGTRPPLGIKRTVETGKVKQSFSHGRSNTVVVEVKKRRILGRPGEAPAAAPEPEAAAPTPAPAPVAAPAPAAPRRSAADDIAARKEDTARRMREAEEARMTALEDARRREEQAKVNATEDEKKRAEDKRKADEEAARQAEEAAVEKAYALRTPQAWTQPFAPALRGVTPTSSSFGQPRTYSAGGPVAYHFGTDYPAPTGTAVLAVNDGTVVFAGRVPVRGNLVIIDHGAGVTSLYFHQSRVVVTAGQRIKRGAKVGEVGTTGLSAGPHLHLEVRVRGEGTSPAGWMGRLWPR